MRQSTMSSKSAGLLALAILLYITALTDGQNSRNRLFRNRFGPGGRFGSRGNRNPSGTVLVGNPVFRTFSPRVSTPPPTVPTTRTTQPTTPATTTPAPRGRLPLAPANDAPPTKPTDTGAKAEVSSRMRNIGKGTGSRPDTPENPVNETRPSTLEKSGHLRGKMPRDTTDEGNDAPSGVEQQNEALNNYEALTPQPVRNIQKPTQTPPRLTPPPSALIGDGGRTRGGPDSGNDAPAPVGFLSNTYGHEFWIAFLDNRIEQPTNQPLEIYVVAGHYASGVRANVKMWYYSPYGRKDEIFDLTEVASDSVKILTVPAYMKNVVNGIFKKGIRVVSDQPISVYAFNYEPFSADAFEILPIDALSTHYIAVTYEQPEVRTQLACVSLADDTLVRVKLPKLPPEGTTEPVVDVEGLRYNAGEDFNVTLSAFEVLSIRSVGDLTGTDVTATEKIACFSGNVRAHVAVGGRGRSRDHLATQLPPVSTWGTEFAIAPAPSGLSGFSLGETHIFVSSWPNTEIVVTESGKAPRTLRIPDPNSKVTVRNLDSFTHVRATKPILVAQVFGSQAGRDSPVTGDPSMMLYSSINQYSGVPQTTLPPEGQFGYINKVLIFIEREFTTGLRMSRKRNNALENRNWVPVPNTNLVGKYLSVAEDKLTQIYHTNPNAKFYVQYFGFSDRESYTYKGAAVLRLTCDRTPVIPADGIDNDCDGRRDEELIDGYDNDGDGWVDEDTGLRHPHELIGGREYVLTFMENAAPQFDETIHLYMAVAPDADSQLVNVTISQPLISVGGIPTTSIVISRGGFQMITIDPDDAVVFGTTLSDKAIRIVASDRIVLYGLNKKLFSMDGNLVFPVDRLGTEYYTVSYSPSHVATQFSIVATEPGTMVDIVFPPEVVGKPWADGRIQVPWAGLEWTNNHALSIPLRQYEVLQMQSGYNLPRDFQNRYLRGDLTGTYIKSNKPIAVFSGNGRVNTRPSNSRDHLVEQLPAVQTWGKEYIVTPTPGRTVGEYYRIIASEPNTRVIVDRSDGDYKSFILNAGEFNQINVRTGGVSASIYADKPILVVMFMKSQQGATMADIEPGDPAMIVIPHVYQWVYGLHFGTPIADYQDFYVTVVLQRKYINGLRMDGALISSSEFIITPRLGRKTYAYVIIRVAQGSNHKITHDNPFASFFAQLYGTKDRESVGYILGINLPILNEAYRYFPTPPKLPGGFAESEFDQFTVELCNDGIDNDGDFLVDEDCEHAHEYYAMFMTNTVPDPMHHSMEIHCVSTSNQNYVRFTTGRINRRVARHEVEKNIITEVILNRDESMLFTVPGVYRAQLSRSGYFDRQFKGVVIESDWALECFAFNKDTHSADGWLMKDYHDLGLHYVVSAAAPYKNHQLVGLVATDDDTEVSITLPIVTDPECYYAYVDVEGFRRFSGESFNITLDRLQIFQLDAKNCFDLTGTYIRSSKPIAVFAGNERTGIPYQAYAGWDHAADQIPRIPTALDLTAASSGDYRYDVLPTPAAQTFDLYQCIGWSAGTTVEFRQGGILTSSQPLGFMGSVKMTLPNSGGAVQITANNPLMCEQFVWSDANRKNNAPELAANILANTYYDSRPWHRFVIPKISTLAGFYDSYVVVSFNLNQIFDSEAPAFFVDGYWIDENVIPEVQGDQAFFTITNLGYGNHYISSAIVDLTDLSIKNVLLRFSIQVHLHSGRESIAYSPVAQQLYTL